MIENEATVMINGKKLPLSQALIEQHQHALAATQHTTTHAISHVPPTTTNYPIQSDTSPSNSIPPIVKHTQVSDTSHSYSDIESSDTSHSYSDIESLIQSMIDSSLTANNTTANQDLRRPGGYIIFGGIGS